MKVKCRGCGEEADDRTKNVGSYNVGEFRVRTGFYPIFSEEGSIIWLCPVCWKEVNTLAKRIMEIVKDDYVNFNCLLQERK